MNAKCATWLLVLILSGCGQELELATRFQAMMGGLEADDERFSSVVSLSADIGNGRYEVFCSGTRVGTHEILTAAHCLTDAEDYPVTQAFKAGKLAIITGLHVNEPSTDRVYPIASFSVHPAFSIASSAHDLAVVWVDREIPESQAKTMQCYRGDNASIVNRHETIQMAGYGVDEAGNSGARSYREATLLAHCAVSGESCLSNEIDETIPPGTFATINDDAVCHGDSGGPLIYREATQSSIVGVISFGTQDCGGYTVSTAISDHAIWLEQTLHPQADGGDCAATKPNVRDPQFSICALILVLCAAGVGVAARRSRPSFFHDIVIKR